MSNKTWPELGEELARKAFDLATAKVAELERGEISQEQAFASIDAAYEICLGIIPMPDADLIYEIRKELQKPSQAN
ncbi:MAG: hypothetical protein JJ979_25080 [Roseibium sp.]|nr:hypothetical protein [Roseibium sp.]